ncbi:type 1 glutamine amidotransferase [Fodinibius salsisoli]|uniref:Type 1 glutamine amidotransferase n=1 Tax=Fodinibius salsisoli TaxID=2820877 RepID=A0ABT3PQZ3_9BACT|nr:type 1 glutamine amidotransferase [Fodinibius salsisoli]MCW9708271.1 type 1 glutamine amidotransferase [Fodinibius salsisoli]
MNIHYLQHVPFEGPGYIKEWTDNTDHQLTGAHLYKEEKLPSPDELDALIVMGGPMGVGDEGSYPWLSPEKELIKRCIQEKKKVLGICLGAQLIADVLGAGVTAMSQKEIGWFPLHWSKESGEHPLLDFLPARQTVLHWHGDMFDIPAGALPLASSDCCPNQGFVIDNQVLGLQFHLEMTPEGLSKLISHSEDKLSTEGDYVQDPETMLNSSSFKTNNKTMAKMLDQFLAAD